ncbi:unnamed protein product [Arctogadus glacialis]
MHRVSPRGLGGVARQLYGGARWCSSKAPRYCTGWCSASAPPNEGPHNALVRKATERRSGGGLKGPARKADVMKGAS